MVDVRAIERRSPGADFHLQTMEDLYDRAGGRPDVPHRHDYYTVMLVERANGVHVIDFKAYPFRSKEVHFVSPGQVHQVVMDVRPKGWFFTFSRSFLAENNIPESFITNINLFKPFGDVPPLSLDRQTFERLHRVIEDMQSCQSGRLNYRGLALGALLQLFLIYCNNSATVDASQLDEESAGVCILRDFKQLVETRFGDWHQVSHYGSAMHITPKHLSQTVKKLTGKTAKEVIQDRLLLEAKRLLMHTQLSVKEVGYTIGFEEPLHFSGFFKRKAGLSPTAFRAVKGSIAHNRD